MGRFKSPDPSQLYYTDPGNPQSFNLYSYGQNNPLVNVDPNGMDCVHINVDSGAFEGFESGDCDNSTEESEFRAVFRWNRELHYYLYGNLRQSWGR